MVRPVGRFALVAMPSPSLPRPRAEVRSVSSYVALLIGAALGRTEVRGLGVSSTQIPRSMSWGLTRPFRRVASNRGEVRPERSDAGFAKR